MLYLHSYTQILVYLVCMVTMILKKICVQLTSIISFIHYAATMSGYYAFLLLFLLLVISLKTVPLNLCCKLCFFLVNNQNLHYKCVCFSDVLFSPCCQPKSCTVNVCFSDVFSFLVISLEIVPINVYFHV